jgi:two-component system cell cycle sensor histidine kinase/response regulator CckA
MMKSNKRHSLLTRQLKKHFGGTIPPILAAFADDVDQAYLEADKDRNMLERALDITSDEMMTVYEDLKRDMDKRLQIEKELSEAKEKMYAAKKHEALGHLAGNIAHDFNNILAIIRSNADILELDGLETKQGIREIQLATERGSGLTRQILAYSKHQKLTLREYDMNVILEKYRLMLEAALGRRISLEYQYSAGPYDVRLDEDQFTQILLNMAVNARDAMGGSGKFTIKTRSCATPEATREIIHKNDLNERGVAAIYENGAADKKFVLLEFSDSGMGIPEENLSKIFEPYFTTKEIGHGTGLGLAVVYGIVKQLNGHIFCTSQVNVGTTFQILLPLALKKAAEVPAGRAPEIERLLDPALIGILIIDDEKPIREAVAYHLKREKFQVSQAANSEEALAFLGDCNEKIDLILSDVTMPGMSGIALAHELERTRPETKIIFMSGFPEQLVKSGGDNDSYPLLQKPFTRNKLLEHVFSSLKIA